MKKKLKQIIVSSALFSVLTLGAVLAFSSVAAAAAPAALPSNSCGGPGKSVTTSIDLGCSHVGNPIVDLLFAIIRLLSDGVGLVVVGSIVVAGIQYTTSRADPNATAQAQNRIRSSLIALLIFIFAYAILNYVVPGQFLH